MSGGSFGPNKLEATHIDVQLNHSHAITKYLIGFEGGLRWKYHQSEIRFLLQTKDWDMISRFSQNRSVNVPDTRDTSSERRPNCTSAMKCVSLHFQEWSISNFLCSLTRNITSDRMKNLAFHSLLRWQMIILLSLIHFSLKGWENVLFELGSERVKRGMVRARGRLVVLITWPEVITWRSTWRPCWSPDRKSSPDAKDGFRSGGLNSRYSPGRV